MPNIKIPSRPKGNGVIAYKCRCACNNEIIIRASNLPRQISCGCERKKSITTHGLSGSKLWNIRNGMINRCYNKNDARYKYYGEKGVIICDEWLNTNNGMTKFYEWSIKNGYKEGLSIDRENPYGNYEPNNCRWITMEEQQYNKRQPKPRILVKYNDELVSSKDIANILGSSKESILAQLRQGKTAEEIIKRHKSIHKKFIYEDKELSIREISDKTGISKQILYNRLVIYNMNIEEAINKPIIKRNRHK